MARKQLVVNQGDKYGRLSIVKEVEKYISINGYKSRQFLCSCECGNTTTVVLKDLRKGTTKSCGCYKKEINAEQISKLRRTHGKYLHPLYHTWEGMKTRCYNKNCPKYEYYGGRGIKVCDRWIQSFDNFLLDMGERPLGMSIDRINNDGNYEPSNCRWATMSQQRINQRVKTKKEVTLELRMQK